MKWIGTPVTVGRPCCGCPSAGGRHHTRTRPNSQQSRPQLLPRLPKLGGYIITTLVQLNDQPAPPARPPPPPPISRLPLPPPFTSQPLNLSLPLPLPFPFPFPQPLLPPLRLLSLLLLPLLRRLNRRALHLAPILLPLNRLRPRRPDPQARPRLRRPAPDSPRARLLGHPGQQDAHQHFARVGARVGGGAGGGAAEASGGEAGELGVGATHPGGPAIGICGFGCTQSGVEQLVRCRSDGGGDRAVILGAI